MLFHPFKPLILFIVYFPRLRSFPGDEGWNRPDNVSFRVRFWFGVILIYFPFVTMGVIWYLFSIFNPWTCIWAVDVCKDNAQFQSRRLLPLDNGVQVSAQLCATPQRIRFGYLLVVILPNFKKPRSYFSKFVGQWSSFSLMFE